MYMTKNKLIECSVISSIIIALCALASTSASPSSYAIVNPVMAIGPTSHSFLPTTSASNNATAASASNNATAASASNNATAASASNNATAASASNNATAASATPLQQQ